ncbi:beta-ketoacyl-ACP reductase [Denitratisoma oestradiolicum]|uniref:3-oxoacyl-[acyl-carrier-protein] reductase n=1 Tax=Denitratisoma oestradiolicum TaxID=311182 RepID=A0A6S6YKP1_9PROT|nr:beta-ketoacyl-ACP reductase [Denitratisoma oestradiolicum]TWO78800.1 beta-ketoacyl-ACP reductase [Denitratisoma oestradiolicum]CAB1368304.1 3-oxoacyl-[acyl-carrier-protein] reductase [Denitratisoma oestradiolicum]
MTKRVALVTGSMGGLGTAICKALAQSGHTVVANCLPNFPPKDEWLAKTRAEGFDFHIAEGDVSDFYSCTAMVRKIEAEIGPVDVLVNNAGITRDGVFRKMDKAQWDAVLTINLDSVFNVTRQVLEGMAERGWGRVINISSLNGIKGQFGQANYSAAKAGILGFTKAIAQEVAKKGVTVNAIAPGYIATEMVMAIKQEVRDSITATIPAGRMGTPEEIGGLCAYLASDIAGYMTGATLNINGGLHMY